MVFAVDTESGIQDIRNLLVFFVARGPFVRLQDRSTGGRRAQRRMSAVMRRLGSAGVGAPGAAWTHRRMIKAAAIPESRPRRAVGERRGC
jgi:hypothetical protein